MLQLCFNVLYERNRTPLRTSMFGLADNVMTTHYKYHVDNANGTMVDILDSLELVTSHASYSSYVSCASALASKAKFVRLTPFTLTGGTWRASEGSFRFVSDGHQTMERLIDLGGSVGMALTHSRYVIRRQTTTCTAAKHSAGRSPSRSPRFTSLKQGPQHTNLAWKQND